LLDLKNGKKFKVESRVS